MWASVTRKVLQLAKDKISDESLLIIDISDIAKSYARKMEYMYRVRDGSKDELADGYWMMQVIAGEAGRSEVIPLYHRLYSSVAPDFEGENLEIIKAVQTVVRGVGDRGTWVVDRGGDRGKLYEFFLNRSLPFLIRLKGDRHLVYRGRKIPARELARSCRLPYREVLVDRKSVV